MDLTDGTVIWRAASDKRKREHTTPLSRTALDALALEYISRGEPSDGWVLLAPKDPTAMIRRDIRRTWWRRAEKLAGIARVHLRGWHSLRRQFATELQAVPLPDLAELGGWKDTRTILLCYQRPDAVTMRKALEERERLVTAG